MTPKFTHGNWYVEYVTSNTSQYPYVRTLEGTICEKVDAPGAFDMESAEANAALIASAPSLYAALTALVNAHDEQPAVLTEEEWNAAREALRKATGE